MLKLHPTPSFFIGSRKTVARRDGFALLITITLLAFLVLLLVSLASLTRVETQVASNTQQLAQARQNALMALSIAVGQLQKYAGPDQRVTATADIAGDASGDRLAANANPARTGSIGASATGPDNGLRALQPGTRYWTGVWGNQDAPSKIFTQTPTPVLLNWLVSGNETARAFNFDTTTGTVSSNSIVAPQRPNLAVGNLTIATNALSANLTVTDGVTNANEPAVLLVGSHTVTSGAPTSADLDNYVVAPIVSITAAPGSVPGLGATATPEIGRYAYWVGDEGVKAKYNLADPYITNPTADQSRYRQLTAQHTGWELVNNFSAYPDPTDAAHASLPKVVSLAQGTLASRSGASASEIQGLGTAVKNGFHTLTTSSQGLLTDSQQGGTRLALNAYLDSANLPAPSASLPRGAPQAGLNIIPGTFQDTTPTSLSPLKGPTWDTLKAFYDLTGDSTRFSSGNLIVKTPASTNEPVIAPLIVEIRILFGVSFDATDPAAVHPRSHVKVAIVLANPYPYPLKWNTPLELEIIDNPGDTPARANDTQGTCLFFSTINGVVKLRTRLIGRSNDGPNDNNALMKGANFTIAADQIPAGQAKIYSIHSAFARADNGAAITVPLTEGIPDQDLTQSLSQEYTTKNVDAKSRADVREMLNSMLYDAELRLSGASQPLRTLKKLEFDESDFSKDNKITFITASTPTAVPLGLYQFMLSQPGADASVYGSVTLGHSNSTLRTFADFNLQATRYRRPIFVYNTPPYFTRVLSSSADLGGRTPGSTGPKFTENLVASPLFWGRAPQKGVNETILFSPQSDFFSLAQLQHADLTADDLFSSIGHQPGNAVGNSYLTPFVTRGQTVQTRTDSEIDPANATKLVSTQTNYYDIAYLLNSSLWDGYFFSSIPKAAAGAAMPLNKRLTLLDPAAPPNDLRDGRKAATLLTVNGAFNVNSTQVEAWKAVLAGTNKVPLVSAGESTTTPPSGAAFARSVNQPSAYGTNYLPTGTDADSFSGYRRLNSAQLDSLATEIVRQVRLRGPFVSLSHFINRALVTPTSTYKDLGLSGALQSAIDRAESSNVPLNNKLTNYDDPASATKTIFNGTDFDGSLDKLKLAAAASGLPQPDFDTTNLNTSPSPYPDASDGNPGSAASIYADTEMLTSPRSADQGFRSTGIPGWLTQADLLQVIGPLLSARSDTFVIRTYGEVRNPLDSTASPLARAWCEAIVQRMPDYVDAGANVATDRATPTSASNTTLTATNATFGRKFKIVSFRWLSPDDI